MAEGVGVDGFLNGRFLLESLQKFACRTVVESDDAVLMASLLVVNPEWGLRVLVRVFF
jgi:hypothetical protein